MSATAQTARAAQMAQAAQGAQDDCRPEVERLVADLPAREHLPQAAGELSFTSPWEIRAFAIAVAAHQSGRFGWGEFQGRLVEEIEAWETAGPTHQGAWSYYREWVDALEGLVLQHGMATPDELDRRIHDYLGGVRDPKHH